MRATPRARYYTLILVGDESSSVRKLHFADRRLRQLAVIFAGAALLGIALSGHYVALLTTRAHTRVEDGALRDENAMLRSQIRAVEERVSHITATLDRVEKFDAKLRDTVKQLQGAPRGLGTGTVQPDEPVAAKPGSQAGGASAPAAQSTSTAPSGQKPRAEPVPSASAEPLEEPQRDRLASLETSAGRLESSLIALQDYFERKRAMLATTPSSWPTRGWVTSDFGERLDPYTAERMMHRGLDIATPPDQAVVAPSDATVAFAGTENGYGKVLVLDHGNGVNTRYGHLSRILVKPGEHVKRGARVATVGNTGRSTGPHLHYEVRVNGNAENPRKFILE